MTHSLRPLNYIVTVIDAVWPNSPGTRHFVAAWTAEDARTQIEVQHEIRHSPKDRFKIVKIEPWVKEASVPERVGCVE